MNKNNTLVALVISGVAAATIALLAFGSGQDPPSPLPGPQLAQAADGKARGSEPEQRASQAKGEIGEPSGEPADSLAARLGGDVNQAMIDPERERRDKRAWESRYKAVDDALVEQVPALSLHRECAMRRVLELFRESRQEILRDLRESAIDRETMRRRARQAVKRRDASLKKVLTPAQYASLDFDEAHFQATK